MNIIKKISIFVIMLGVSGFAIQADEVASSEMPKATVTVLGAKTLTPEGDNYYIYDGGLHEAQNNLRLQVLMNFKAEETYEEAKNGKFGKYLCDFYLSFSGLKNGSIDGKGCYLAGKYGEYPWIAIPTDIFADPNTGDFVIEENVPYPVVAFYDPELTYENICDYVKDFIAAIQIKPEILDENPDFKVTLALKMTNPDTKEEITVGEPATYTAEELKNALLPTATVSPVENDDLNFALNFKADPVDDAQLERFGKWYADFVLTVNKDITFNANGGADGYLSGQYNSWSENWVNVPFENVELKAGQSLKIMEYAAEMLGESGLKMTYEEIYSVVSDFNCGVFFEPAYLEANPDLKVTLELRMYNNKNEAETYVIGETYEFTAPKVAAIGDAEYSTLKAAVEVAGPNDTIKLLKNAKLAETLVIPSTMEALTIDLNGCEIYSDADAAAIVNEGKLTIKDSAGDMEGCVCVDFVNSGSAQLTAGLFIGELSNVEGGKVDVTGGVYFDADICGWVVDGYAASKFEEQMEENGGVIDFVYYAVAKLPTATVRPVPDSEMGDPLTFALKFKADSVTDYQLACFGDWYADFVLTVNKTVVLNANGGDDSNGYLSGQYDEWSEDWVNVPFENVTLTADKPLKVMEYAAELMNKKGLKITYREVYEGIKEFDCGVFFKPEFLEANPDLEVGLALRMFNPVDETEYYTIGIDYLFTPPTADDHVSVRDGNGMVENFESWTEAIESIIAKGGKVNGGKVTVLQDSAITSDLTVTGTDNIFFDMNGKTLAIDSGKKLKFSNVNVAFTGTGAFKDFTAANIELDDKSVLTLPNTASAEVLAENLEAAGKYVTKNEDNTWSVANKFELQIQINGNEPSLGFLEDTRRDYVIEASTDLVTWEAVDTVVGQGASEVAVPLKWKAPQAGTFFRVKAEMK